MDIKAKNFFNDDMAFRDIISILNNSWKIIFIFGLIGVVGAFILRSTVNNQYEARVYLGFRYADFKTIDQNWSAESDLAFLNLITKSLEFYSLVTLKNCAISNVGVSPVGRLFNSGSLSISKNSPFVMELRASGSSEEDAITCAESMINDIRTFQNQKAKAYIKEAKSLLPYYQNEFLLLKSQMFREKKESDLGSFAKEHSIDLSLALMMKSFNKVSELKFLAVNAEKLTYLERLSPISVIKISKMPRKDILFFVCSLLVGFFIVFAKNIAFGKKVKVCSVFPKK